MDVPETLTQRIELYKAGGRIFGTENDLFTQTSWRQVLVGQNCPVEGYPALADYLSDQQLNEFLNNLKVLFKNTANKLPNHRDFLNKHAKADS